MPVTDLLQTQVGKETTWATSATATAKLMGIESCQLKPGAKAEVNADMRGSLGPATIAYATENSGAATVKTKVLYEDIPYWLEGLFGIATPSGAGPYTRNYAAPSTAPANVRMQTLYYGEGSNVYKLLGAIPTKMEITGETNKPLMASIDLIGQQVAIGALAALSDRAVSPVMGHHVSVFLDNWAGTMGTTPLNATAYAFKLAIAAPRTLSTYLGSMVGAAFNEQRYKADANTLELSCDFPGSVKSYIDSIIGGTLTQLQVRIKAQSASNVQQFDFAGTVTEPPQLFDDRDGVCSVTLKLVGTYHNTLANWFKAQNVNAVAALA